LSGTDSLTPHRLGQLLTQFLFFFAPTPTTQIYTLSLHDALPIWSADYTFTTNNPEAAPVPKPTIPRHHPNIRIAELAYGVNQMGDRKSTRLNSSHVAMSYAVFCLKKKTYRSTPPMMWSPSAPSIS